MILAILPVSSTHCVVPLRLVEVISTCIRYTIFYAVTLKEAPLLMLVAAQGRLGYASYEGSFTCLFCDEKLVKVLFLLGL
ncbi:hypothetical protein ccbrp13_37960 [Ktedonobacteria bacterium brp13]|nr:hypothetical protein ccbrp13_37960 [Ktedonobacteria bacterium brp13]